MRHPEALNIEDLRCNSFASAGNEFDMLRFEEFAEETITLNFPHRYNYYMIFVPTAGSGTHLIDFESYDIVPGRVFLMYPGMIHSWEAHKDLKGFLIFFTQEFFTQRYNNNNLFEFPFFTYSHGKPWVHFDERKQQELEQLCACMLDEYESKEEEHLRTMRSYVNIILFKCKRIFSRQYEKESVSNQHIKLLMQRFIILIERYFREKHLVKDYADLLHITPNYLNIICKSHTGNPAGEMVRYRILLEIKRKLLHEDKTISVISNELGFRDQAYFSRFFKKYTGLSPDNFRKQVIHFSP